MYVPRERRLNLESSLQTPRPLRGLSLEDALDGLEDRNGPHTRPLVPPLLLPCLLRALWVAPLTEAQLAAQFRLLERLRTYRLSRRALLRLVLGTLQVRRMEALPVRRSLFILSFESELRWIAR